MASESYQHTWNIAKATGKKKKKPTLEDEISKCLIFNSDVAEVENESIERQRKKTVAIMAENDEIKND